MTIKKTKKEVYQRI